MSQRRAEFAMLLPQMVGSQGKPVHLSEIYATVERDHPHLVDDEVEPPPSNALRWKHDLRWELETLVVKGELRQRKDLGPALYSK